MSQTAPTNTTAGPTEDLSQYCTADGHGLKCVCSKTRVQKIGSGATTKKHFHNVYFYVEQTGENEYGMWQLNNNWVPTGSAKSVTLEEITSEFQPEVELYFKKVGPAMKKLNKTIAKADRHRKNDEPFSAEMEYNNALAIDERNVRATFGLGLTYLSTDQSEKAQGIFNILMDLEAAFEAKHKFLFNEFGIALRKQKLYSEALAYYHRALNLCTSDENLYFNIARTHLEQCDWRATLYYLTCALELAPAHEPSRKVGAYMIKIFSRKAPCPLCRKPATDHLGKESANLLATLKNALLKTGEEQKQAIASLKNAVKDAAEEPRPKAEAIPDPEDFNLDDRA